jgi:hypothetical protein
MRRRSKGARPPNLTVAQILAWADEYHGRTGKWPTTGPLRIAGSLGETWRRVDGALRVGCRGLPGGSSLPQLLAAERGYRNSGALPRLSIRQILALADAHYRRCGHWPTIESGAVIDANGETWKGIDAALRLGLRGLRRGTSLARLLARERGKRNPVDLPRLTLRQILSWADEHHRRTGQWPTSQSGPVHGVPGESWSKVAGALANGRRGLSGHGSLARLLARARGVARGETAPRLSLKQIRAWAKAHRRRTGEWPTTASGTIPEAPLGDLVSHSQDSLRGVAGLGRWANAGTTARKATRRPLGAQIVTLACETDPRMGRCALPPTRAIAKRTLRTNSTRDWRDVARCQSSFAQWIPWLAGRLLPRSTVGRQARRSYVSPPPAVDSVTNSGLGRCSFSAHGDLANGELWGYSRRAWRDLASH